MVTTDSPSLKDLLCKLERYAPDRIRRSSLGTLWDLRLEPDAMAGAYLMENADSPVDKALLIAGSFLEAQQRNWLIGLSNSPEDSSTPSYFCRIELGDEAEVSEESSNPAIACVGALVKAFELELQVAHDAN